VNMSLNGPDRYTIMIVDDNRHLLVALGDYLTFQGYDVVTAATGEEALRKLERGGADLIVLDIGMPGMGGMWRAISGKYCHAGRRRQGPLRVAAGES